MSKTSLILQKIKTDHVQGLKSKVIKVIIGLLFLSNEYIKDCFSIRKDGVHFSGFRCPAQHMVHFENYVKSMYDYVPC
jgi:hypothetical protein